jgi:hypothetical protein
MLRMPALRAAWKTLNVLRMLLWNVATSLRMPGAGIAEQCVDRLAVVRQVDPHETRTARPSGVKVDHIMSGLTQHGDNRAPQLARPRAR